MVCVEMEALAMLGHMGHNKDTSGSQCPPQLMCSKTLRHICCCWKTRDCIVVEFQSRGQVALLYNYSVGQGADVDA